jgi:hypothetical protein
MFSCRETSQALRVQDNPKIYVRIWIFVRRTQLDDVPHALSRAMFAFDSIIICGSAVCQNQAAIQNTAEETYVPIYDSVKLTLSLTRCIVGRTIILRQSCERLAL